MRENFQFPFLWRFRPLCSSAPRDKVNAHYGVVNTFPTRNHAMSLAIFHLGVAGRDLSKHLMKVLTWRWSPLAMSKRFCCVASSIDIDRNSAGETILTVSVEQFRCPEVVFSLVSLLKMRVRRVGPGCVSAVRQHLLISTSVLHSSTWC